MFDLLYNIIKLPPETAKTIHKLRVVAVNLMLTKS